jgi:ABC-type sugar transport system substrate-binding protein
MTKRSVKIFLLVLSTVAFVAVSASAMNQKSTATDPPKLVYFIFTGYAYPYFAPMAKAVMLASAHFPDMAVRIVNAENGFYRDHGRKGSRGSRSQRDFAEHDSGIGHRRR